MAVELKTEAATLQRIKSGKLVEGLEHMSPTYLEGIKRILTVSADTELISAPAYFRAAQDAPSLNAFGTAISIVVSEKTESAIGPIPTANMWCAQTPKPRKPMAIPE